MAPDSVDYVLNGTRVVCNPRGYAKDGVSENPQFDANFLIEIQRNLRGQGELTPFITSLDDRG